MSQLGICQRQAQRMVLVDLSLRKGRLEHPFRKADHMLISQFS